MSRSLEQVIRMLHPWLDQVQTAKLLAKLRHAVWYDRINLALLRNIALL